MTAINVLVLPPQGDNVHGNTSIIATEPFTLFPKTLFFWSCVLITVFVECTKLSQVTWPYRRVGVVGTGSSRRPKVKLAWLFDGTFGTFFDVLHQKFTYGSS